MDKEYFNKLYEKYKDSFLMKNFINILEEIECENIDNSKNNIVKFICRRSFHDLFSIKVEWNKNNGLFVLNMIPVHSLKEENVKHYIREINKENLDARVQERSATKTS